MSTNNSFVTKANAVHGSLYIYDKVVYINSRSKVTVTCRKHGDFEQTAHTHLQGSGCPTCAKITISSKLKALSSKVMRPAKTQEQAVQDLVKKRGHKYDYSLVQYANDRSKVTIICRSHGSFEQAYSNHLNLEYDCPKCAHESQTIKAKAAGTERSLKVAADIVNRFVKVHGAKYDYSCVVYKNQRAKVDIVCYVHGPFEQHVKHHLEGKGCPSCNSSHGERQISEWLELNRILFKCNMVILGFNPRKRFDFYLPAQDLYIEYDGIQHFEVVPSWGGEKRLIVQQYRDKEATDWCRKNGVRLLRIRYDENVEAVLAKVLF